MDEYYADDEQENLDGQTPEENDDEQNIQEQEEQEEIEQEQIEQEEAQQEEDEYLKVKEKLNKLDEKVKSSLGEKTSFTFSEKKDLKAAKEYRDLKHKANKIKAKVAFNKIKDFIKKYGPYILWGILILLAVVVGIIVLVSIIGTIFPWLFSDGDSSEGAASPFGVKGDKFYGVRYVYEDNELARAGIIENYYQVLDKTINQIIEISVLEVDGTSEVVSITIQEQGKLPTDLDYANLEKLKDYENLYNYFENLAKTEYKLEYNQESSLTLAENLDQIKYFGLLNRNEIKQLVQNYIENHIKPYLTIKQGETEIDISNTNFDAVATEKINLVLSAQKRTEKLFVVDKILTEEDSYVEDIQKLNYKYIIYMPKTDVKISSMLIALTNQAEYTLQMKNGEINIDLIEGTDETVDENMKEYSASEINVTKFEDINENNLDFLTQPSSLVDVILKAEENGVDYNKYLTLTSDGTTNYYTVKVSGLHLIINSETPFYHSDVDIQYN